MAQQLKRWESPRRPGRNHKGRGGSARQRQLRKRGQGLRHRLRQGTASQPSVDNSTHPPKESLDSLFLCQIQGFRTQCSGFHNVPHATENRYRSSIA